MANSYSAPDFDIDTDVNVAGLTTLKGSAPALTDNIYIFNGARLTVESALSILKIYLGQTSAGAAGAGNRFGHLTVNADQTVTFAGNATATNSGIQSNPTSADASSLNSTITLSGTSGNRVTLTNDGDAASVTKRWLIQFPYGSILSSFTSFRYPGQSAFSFNANTARTNASKQSVTDAILLGFENNIFVSQVQSLTIDVDIEFKDWELTIDAALLLRGIRFELATGLATGTTIDFRNWKLNMGSASSKWTPVYRIEASAVAALFSDGCRFSRSDIRTTDPPAAGTLVASQTDDDTIRLTFTKPADVNWAQSKLYVNRGGGWTLLNTFTDTGTFDDTITAFLGFMHYIAVPENGSGTIGTLPTALASQQIIRQAVSWSQLRDEFATLIGAVAGITGGAGKVHKFWRNTNQWKAYFDKHKGNTSKINNWEITRSTAGEDLIAVENAVGTEPYYHDVWTVRVRGMYGVKDADDPNDSEKVFQQLIDDVVQKIRLNPLVNGRVIVPRSIQVPIIEHRTFGGVLVHWAELDFEAIVRLTG